MLSILFGEPLRDRPELPSSTLKLNSLDVNGNRPANEDRPSESFLRRSTSPNGEDESTGHA